MSLANDTGNCQNGTNPNRKNALVRVRTRTTTERYPETWKRDAVRRYENGERVADIASAFRKMSGKNISSGTVYYWLKAWADGITDWGLSGDGNKELADARSALDQERFAAHAAITKEYDELDSQLIQRLKRNG